MKFVSVCLIGCLGSLLSSLPAHGADMIILKFQAVEIQLFQQDFETMAQTGKVPDEIKAILGDNFKIPLELQQLLSRPIQLPSSVETFLNSDTGEFLLNRMDTLIHNSSGQASDNLTYLKSAFTDAVENQQVSLLDLIRQYPQETVQINLTGLEKTYIQVAQFLANLKSDSSGTKQFLANLLCNCPQASTTQHLVPGSIDMTATQPLPSSNRTICQASLFGQLNNQP